ncbi:MAG: precorrin-2 C(20)-methyltransferase [Cellvibrionales bacterium]|nr:precorrin-2 C(20)-methyltransferase [Cellvibrionales bacterium]
MSQDLGLFYGIGVGPGDPELLTLKAYQMIAQCDVVAFLVNDQGESQSKHIARQAMGNSKPDQVQLPIPMPMSKDRRLANVAYDDAALKISEYLSHGNSVGFLCEGDPLFYGSFIYLLDRLSKDFTCEVIPGISSVHAASAQLKTPLVQQSESLAVLSGRVTDAQTLQALENFESIVLLKAGERRQDLMRLIREANREKDAQYIEYISRANEKIIPFTDLQDTPGPYFSLFFVTRNG